MEIIEPDEHARDGLVQIAFADTRQEAALIRGLLREEGIRSIGKEVAYQGRGAMFNGSPRRIFVHPDRAAAARALLAETMVEVPPEDEIPEPANAEYLADAAGHRPRDYSPLGGLARGWIAAVALLGLVLVAFLVLH